MLEIAEGGGARSIAERGLELGEGDGRAGGQKGGGAPVPARQLVIAQAQDIPQRGESGPAALQPRHGPGETVPVLEPGQHGLGLAQHALRGTRAWSRQPALCPLGELRATPVELPMGQGEGIRQVLAPFALQDPQQQHRQIRAQQFPQAATHLAAPQLAAQRRVLDIEQLAAHGRKQVATELQW